MEKTLKVSLRLLFALVPVFLFAPGLRGQHAADPAANIDPLLGVAGGGNVFPGPVVPFGMIKPGPDMAARPGHDANAGWNEKDDIRGFSQTHVSGTGGGAKYGNILVEPTTGVIAPMDSASPRAR